MITVFERWGLPERIKTDNGYPVVYTGARDVPTPLRLWLIGLGIDAVANRPRRPQDNGTVENLQGTSCRWVNPGQFRCPEDLQRGLNEVAREQREVYRLRAKDDLTRLQLFPQLETNPRRWTGEDSMFDIERVYDWLEKIRISRRVYSNGRVSFGNFDFQAGTKYKGKNVIITFDRKDKMWHVKLDDDGSHIKSVKGLIITKESVLNLSFNMSKN